MTSNLNDLALVNQPQPAAQAGATFQAEAETASRSSGASDPEPIPSIRAEPSQQPPRAWFSGNPYYPFKPTNRDEGHWKKAFEKADQFDKEFCGGWNSEIDSLLTFAGLFSAVVTAFTVDRTNCSNCYVLLTQVNESTVKTQGHLARSEVSWVRRW
ncbi:hypothetical protein BD779DRAFT_1676360 [Infundibulicybe gibba]|nr:hypothetical protein BD779DRAFT_1676360 [Infundibulicybe gibba]